MNLEQVAKFCKDNYKDRRWVHRTFPGTFTVKKNDTVLGSVEVPVNLDLVGAARELLAQEGVEFDERKAEFVVRRLLNVVLSIKNGNDSYDFTLLFDQKFISQQIDAWARGSQ